MKKFDPTAIEEQRMKDSERQHIRELVEASFMDFDYQPTKKEIKTLTEICLEGGADVYMIVEEHVETFG